MKNFNWEEFKTKDIAIRISTTKQFNDFREKCKKNNIDFDDFGITYDGDILLVDCLLYNGDVYYIDAGREVWYLNKNYKIIEWTLEYDNMEIESVVEKQEKIEYTYQELIPIIKDGQIYESISDGFRVKSVAKERDTLHLNGNDDLCDLLDKSVFPISLNQKFKLKQPTKEHYVYYVKLSEDGEEIKVADRENLDYNLHEIVECTIDSKKYYGKITNRIKKELTEKEYSELPTIETIDYYRFE